MPQTQFESKTRYGNELLFPLTIYPRFKVPTNVPLVYAPIFTDSGTLYKMAQPSKSLVVGGYTDPKFSLRFSDFDNQWKQTQPSNPESAWEFQGGVVFLELTITVYVNQVFQNLDKVLVMIMEHELLHVSDEINIATQYLPTHAPKGNYVKKFLIGREKVDNRTFENWIKSKGFENYLRDEIYVPEHNRLAEARDFGREYNKYQKKIDDTIRLGGAGRR